MAKIIKHPKLESPMFAFQNVEEEVYDFTSRIQEAGQRKHRAFNRPF